MIYQLLKTVTTKHKRKTALVFEQKSFSYDQFLRHVDHLASEISILGIEESNICLVSPNRPDTIFLMVALAKGSNMVTPIDYFSSASELRAFCDLYQSDYIICHSSLLNKLKTEFPELAASIDLEETSDEYKMIALGQNRITSKYNKPTWLGKMFGKSRSVEKHEMRADQPFIYFSSSGSSGDPKVFPLSLSQLYHQIINVRDNFKFSSTDRALCALHYSHNHAICLIFATLAGGGTIHLIPVEKALAPYISKYINDFQITLFSHVPLIYKAFVDVAVHLGKNHFYSLRMAICGSAPLSAEVAKSFYEKFGKHLHQSYGLSEIGPVCVNLFEEGDHRYGSVGKIFPEIEYKIVDENEQPVVQGEEGHLLLRGLSMTDGYLQNPKANQLMFRNGWLHSQDIVREDEHGNLAIIGRKSNFINVGGLKVFPAEIERVIMNMDAVREVAVDARNDDFFGQVAEAYVVIHKDKEVTEAEIKSHCIKNLSSFKVPKSVVFLNEMPKNGIGKIVNSKLRNT